MFHKLVVIFILLMNSGGEDGRQELPGNPPS